MLAGCCNKPTSNKETIILSDFLTIETAWLRADYHWRDKNNRRQTNRYYITARNLHKPVIEIKYHAWQGDVPVGYQRTEVSFHRGRQFLQTLERAKLRKCRQGEYQSTKKPADRNVTLHHASHVHTFGSQFGSHTPRLLLQAKLKEYGGLCGDIDAVEIAFQQLIPFAQQHFKKTGQLRRFKEKPYPRLPIVNAP